MRKLGNNFKAASVFTVQHTGTWFILDFLKEYLGKGFNLIQLSHFISGIKSKTGDNIFRKDKLNILHHHLYAPYNTHGDFIEGGAYTTPSPYYGPEQFLFDQTRRSVPFLITVRDPLLSLISRQNRHPTFSHGYMVLAFEHISELNVDKEVFFPIDLDYTYDQKVEYLKRILVMLEIPYLNKMKNVLDNHAKKWSSTNKSKDQLELKVAYAANDFDHIKKYLGPEFTTLLSKRDIIIPFLKKVGYKDLGWWEL